MKNKALDENVTALCFFKSRVLHISNKLVHTSKMFSGQGNDPRTGFKFKKCINPDWPSVQDLY